MTKTREQIIHYLGIEPDYMKQSDLTTVIDKAIEIENNFADEIKNHTLGYGLVCDFDCNSEVLEDKNLYNIKEVTRYLDGIVLYQITEKGDLI